MKGLFLKDWLLTKHYLKSMLLAVACFAVVGGIRPGNAFLTVYPGVMAALLPVYLVTYDEREKWNIYCQSMPVTRSQYVTGKYLYGLAAAAAVLALHGLGLVIGLVTNSGLTAQAHSVNLVTLLSAALLGQAISFPLLFRFGAERWRMVYACIFGVLIAGSALLPALRADGETTRLLSVSPALAAVAVCGIAVAAYALSWHVSIHVYQRREL